MPIDSARIAHIILHYGVTFGLGYDDESAPEWTGRRFFPDLKQQEAYDMGRALARGGWTR